MTISIEQVRELRERTGAGVLDAKKALQATDGDIDNAIQLLREKGMAKAAKKASRQANEGIVVSYLHRTSDAPAKIGVLLELACETDFVARTEGFQELGAQIARQIAAMRPQYVSDADVPEEVLDAERETLAKAAAQEDGNSKKPAAILEKIAQGRLEKWLDEVVLLRQDFIRQDGRSVGELITAAIAEMGENILVRRFSRFEIGE